MFPDNQFGLYLRGKREPKKSFEQGSDLSTLSSHSLEWVTARHVAEAQLEVTSLLFFLELENHSYFLLWGTLQRNVCVLFLV